MHRWEDHYILTGSKSAVTLWILRKQFEYKRSRITELEESHRFEIIKVYPWIIPHARDTPVTDIFIRSRLNEFYAVLSDGLVFRCAEDSFPTSPELIALNICAKCRKGFTKDKLKVGECEICHKKFCKECTKIQEVDFIPNLGDESSLRWV